MLQAAYRGPWNPPGAGRPAGVALPPAAMPMRRGTRLRKRWRYVGAYGAEAMACFGSAAIGPFRRHWWAVWDRGERRLHERTTGRSGVVEMAAGAVVVRDGDTSLRVEFDEGPGFEVVTPYPPGYAWTAKQAPASVRITGTLAGRPFHATMAGLVDDSAGYHPRRTSWRWSAGVGESAAGEPLAWNLVQGVHDLPGAAEQTVWRAGTPAALGPVAFDGLERISFAEGGELRFAAESTRTADENRLLIRSRYEQPFGTFAGELPGGLVLARGFGVMERHDVVW